MMKEHERKWRRKQTNTNQEKRI